MSEVTAVSYGRCSVCGFELGPLQIVASTVALDRLVFCSMRCAADWNDRQCPTNGLPPQPQEQREHGGDEGDASGAD